MIRLENEYKEPKKAKDLGNKTLSLNNKANGRNSFFGNFGKPVVAAIDEKTEEYIPSNQKLQPQLLLEYRYYLNENQIKSVSVEISPEKQCLKNIIPSVML